MKENKKTNIFNKLIIKKGLLSIEELAHFQCGYCCRWWSIGDFNKNKKRWFCPWCGKNQELKK